MAYVREVRGIPLWLLREYLVEAGGRAVAEDRVAGNGWEVRLTQLEDFRVGSLAVGRLRVELDGDAGAVEAMRAVLEKKLLRAGG